MKKKYGGKIKNWRVHKLAIPKDLIDEVYPGTNAKALVVTGVVVNDALGRWLPGDHMKTSLVVKLDRKNGKLETLNTLYDLEGKEDKNSIAGMEYL